MTRYTAFLLIVLIGIGVWFLTTKQDPILLDDAGLLADEQRAFISEYHGYLLSDHEIDYRVVTTADRGSILEDAVSRYEELNIGSRSASGRGLLLIINPVTDQVRLEVGYALEGSFPDAFVAYIEQRQMVPFFADGHVADGILATTELIIDRAQRAAVRDGIDADEVWVLGSGGAGAQTRAQIGAGRDVPADTGSAAATVIGVAESPTEALAAYFQAMDERNPDPRLTIYSPETMDMLQQRTITPAQMDMIVRTYRACNAEPVRYDSSGTLAVIRYPQAERGCSPWFFVRAGGSWTLNLAVMNSAIRFGRTNAWHRSNNGFGTYAFAFDDWTFDRNGFPETSH